MKNPWEKKWELGDRLGKGGQGITHRVMGKDPIPKIGALKYLKNNKDLQARSRMRQEVANLQALGQHGGSVPIILEHNTDQYEDLSVNLYVIMELIEGPTLKEYVENHGPLSIETATEILLSICRSVKIALTFPILHRDLKPENIIVRNEIISDIVIIDYGLSFRQTNEGVTQVDETFRNQFLDLPETNTPGGNRRDFRSDLTALCALYYYCLTNYKVGQLQDGTGTPPHNRIGYSIRDTILDDVRIAQVDVFLTRGFAIDVANRFQDLESIVTGLQSILDASKENDLNDPIELASMLSDEIRKTDRKTQLVEFKAATVGLFKFIDNSYRPLIGKLGKFSIVRDGGALGGYPKILLPPELDYVDQMNGVIRIHSELHKYLENRLYVVAATGEECILYAADYPSVKEESHRQNSFRPAKIDEHPVTEEVARYQGFPEPIFDLVANSLNQWILDSLKKLHQNILFETGT